MTHRTVVLLLLLNVGNQIYGAKSHQSCEDDVKWLGRERVNRLNITRLLNHFRLKQIVKIPTRKEATLDLILTNMHKHDNLPPGFPGFGLSDHNTVIVAPKNTPQNTNTKKVITIRDQRASRKAEMGRYLSTIDWSSLFTPLDTCENIFMI